MSKKIENSEIENPDESIRRGRDGCKEARGRRIEDGRSRIVSLSRIRICSTEIKAAAWTIREMGLVPQVTASIRHRAPVSYQTVFTGCWQERCSIASVIAPQRCTSSSSHLSPTPC